MRKPFLITYSINDNAGKYKDLFEAIKEFKGWWHYLDNTWLIMYDGTASEIYGKLKPHLDGDINLLVIEVGSDRQGWLPPKAWEWFKRNIPRKED